MACEGNESKETIQRILDEKIKAINDDYRVERNHALKKVLLDVVPNQAFIEWLKSKGKEGAQVKFPRVLKKEQYEDWNKFVKNYAN
jgi:hypothetical protein